MKKLLFVTLFVLPYFVKAQDSTGYSPKKYARNLMECYYDLKLYDVSDPDCSKPLQQKIQEIGTWLFLHAVINKEDIATKIGKTDAMDVGKFASACMKLPSNEGKTDEQIRGAILWTALYEDIISRAFIKLNK